MGSRNPLPVFCLIFFIVFIGFIYLVGLWKNTSNVPFSYSCAQTILKRSIMSEENNGGICRCCLASVKKKCMSLYETYKNYLVYNHINAIANVQISESDGLPDKICSKCLLDLETAINFKQKCESTNIILQTSLMVPKTAIEFELKEVIVKKEEPLDDIQFMDADAEYFDPDFYDEQDKKPGDAGLNMVDLGLRKSRAIDLRLQCNECGSFFKSKCKLRVHWKKTHISESLKCQNCKRIFKSYKAYNHHQKYKSKSCMDASNFRIEGEGKLRRFYCKECKYMSVRMKDMITHWVVHTGDRPFKCDLCPKTCTQQSSLMAHKESAHQEYKVEIACHVCGKIVKGRGRIYRHLKTHKDNRRQCTICQKMLKNKNSLRVHMQRHSGVKSFTCEKCAHTFYTSAELANHKRTVHNKGKYWYKCDLCEYKSIRSETLKKHKVRHTDVNLPCTVCGMFFENAQKLILHQRRHFEEKRYQCLHCEKKFFRRDSVGKHIRAKHRCTMVVNQRPTLTLKEVNPVAASHFEDVIEIEVSPVNAK